MADCNKAIELNPTDAIAYNNRGNAYSGLQEYHKAIEDYSRSLQIAPSADTYYNRAKVYFSLQEYEKALEDLFKARNTAIRQRNAMTYTQVEHLIETIQGLMAE